MSTELGALWTIAGLAGIAALYFLLHRLRVRQRLLVVETTQFWRLAAEQTRARVFTERFRHPWTWLLLVTISALLWLAFAGLRPGSGETRHALVLIDGSAAMARGERFARTIERAQTLVAGLPAARRRVVLCGGRQRTLLAPGEHERLLHERLAASGPEATPSSIAAAIRRELARERDAPLDVYVAGDACLEADFVQSLPADVRVLRVAADAAEEESGSPAGRGITALGVTEAQSGEPRLVDVLVEVSANRGLPTPPPALLLGGAALEIAPEPQPLPWRASGATSVQYVYRDVPARGELLELRLPPEAADALPIDDHAAFVLPDRRPLRVALEAGLPRVLERALAADAAFQVVTGPADVVLRWRGSAFGGEVPALELVPPDADGETAAFTVTCGPEEDPHAVVAELYEELGLGEIDAAELARRSGRVIAIEAEQGPRRALVLWARLLSEDFNFVQSRSFPLFVALGLRWLAGLHTPPASLAAGVAEDLRDETWLDESGVRSAALGDLLVVPRAGLYRAASGEQFAASLLDPDTTSPPIERAAVLAAAEADYGADPITWLLVGAFLLLLVEWALFQRGRIP